MRAHKSHAPGRYAGCMLCDAMQAANRRPTPEPERQCVYCKAPNGYRCPIHAPERRECPDCFRPTADCRCAAAPGQREPSPEAERMPTVDPNCRCSYCRGFGHGREQGRREERERNIRSACNWCCSVYPAMPPKADFDRWHHDVFGRLYLCSAAGIHAAQPPAEKGQGSVRRADDEKEPK